MVSSHSSAYDSRTTKTMLDTGVEYHVQTQPWRYRCPHCGHSGHALRRRYKRLSDMDQYVEVDADGRGTADSRPSPSDVADFYCDDCETPVEEPEEADSTAGRDGAFVSFGVQAERERDSVKEVGD